MLTESDRAAGLLAGMYVEAGLQSAITSWIVSDADVLRGVFEDASAPLGTFSAKIKMGRALGLYDPETERTLDQIRTIRNVFAHALRPVDFDHPTIADVVRSLSKGPMPEGTNINPVRLRYMATAHSLFRQLYAVALKNGDRKLNVELP